MNPHTLSPYIRLASRQSRKKNLQANTRILLDYELQFLEVGEFLLMYPEETFLCSAPVLLLICPGIPHSMKVLTPVIEETYIHFDLLYDQYSEMFKYSIKRDHLTSEEKLILRPNIFKNIGLSSPIINICDIDTMRAMFYDIIDTFCAKNHLYELNTKYKMLSLLSFLFNRSLPDCFEYNDKTDTALLKVKNYIDLNYESELSLNGISQKFHYNPRYLTSAFSKRFGTTLMAYYRGKRLDAAKVMLISDNSISDVADKLVMV